MSKSKSEKKLENVHQLTREVANWTEYYRRWSISQNATPEMKRGFLLLDEFTQKMVNLFGDPSDYNE